MAIDINWIEGEICSATFTADEKDVLQQMMTEVSVAAGDKIISEGQGGGTLEFLYSGKAKIEDNNRFEDSLLLAEIESGSLMGELTFLNNKRRTADVTAVEDCVVYQLSQPDFSTLMKNHPDLVYHIMSAIMKHQGNVIMTQRVTLAPELRQLKDKSESIPLFAKVAIVVFIAGLIYTLT